MDLQASDQLHLTCVRGGGCCHAEQIPLTPWEIARLARALGLAPAAARDRLTVAGGTRMRAEGPPGRHAHPACNLLGEHGCTVHAARPLACRLFPLGRRLGAGRAVYHMADTHRCLPLCPDVTTQPPVRVDAWLRGQEVASGEVAHDAYGRLVSGLLSQAGQLASGDAFAQTLPMRAALNPQARAATLTRAWYDLTSAPDLPAALCDDPAAFVLAHAERILGAVAAGFAGDPPHAAMTLATVALQLGEPLGIPPAAAVAHALQARVR